MISRRGVNLRTEAIAGITTFFTMSYIVVVNPTLLASPGTGIPFAGAMTATVLLSFLLTLMMGLYANLPFAVAPGMGINAFFTFSLILGRNIPWPVALGMVFWSGVLFLLVSITPLRLLIAQAIPRSLRIGTAAGIGIFLSLIGLKNAGIVVADATTLVRLGHMDLRALMCLLGIVVAVYFLRKKSPFAFLITLLGLTGVGLVLGLVHPPAHWVAAPDFTSVFLKLDVVGSFKLALLPAIISLMFTDLFDSISTFVGVAHAAKLVDNRGEMVRMKEGLIVDSFATFLAGIFGTSAGTAYIESAAGIEVGGRTGWTSVFTALCFIPCFFLGPVAGMVPPFATAPILILLGALMFRSLSELKFDSLEDTVPAFLTVILIPLTFSITQGILWGFISYVVLYVVAGRGREVKPTLYGIALLSVFLIWLEHG